MEYSPFKKNFQEHWENFANIKNTNMDGFSTIDLQLTLDMDDRLPIILALNSDELIHHYVNLKKRNLSLFQITLNLLKSLAIGTFGALSDLELFFTGVQLIITLITKGQFSPYENLFEVSFDSELKFPTVFFYTKYLMQISPLNICQIIVLLQVFAQEMLFTKENRYVIAREDIFRILEECQLMYPIDLWKEEEESIRRFFGLLTIKLDSDFFGETREVQKYRNLPRQKVNFLRPGLCYIIYQLFSNLDSFYYYIKEALLTKMYYIFEEKTSISSQFSAINVPPFFVRSLSSFQYLPLADTNFQGGFYPRLGRAPNTGLGVVGIHSSLFYLFPGLIPGSQLYLENFSTLVSISPVDSISGPLVQLSNGSVIRINSLDDLVQEVPIIKIIHLGTVLIDPITYKLYCYRSIPIDEWQLWWEFVQRWWINIATDEKIKAINLLKVKDINEMTTKINKNFPFTNEQLFILWKHLKVPFPGPYIPRWGKLTSKNLQSYFQWLLTCRSTNYDKLEGPYNEEIKKFLILGEVPFIKANSYIIISDHSQFFQYLAIRIKESVAVKTSFINDFLELNFQDFLMQAYQINFTPQLGTIGAVLGFQWKTNLMVTNPEIHGYYSQSQFETIKNHWPKLKQELNLSFQLSEVKTLEIKNSTEISHQEDIRKILLRKKHNLSIFKGPNIVFRIANGLITHFRSNEIHTTIKRLQSLGYFIDSHGNPLTTSIQELTLLPHDIILPLSLYPKLKQVYDFIDDILVNIYHLTTKFTISSPEDVLGKYFVGCNPSSSIGVIGRLIGWSSNELSEVLYANPLWHAQKYSQCINSEPDYLYIFEDLLLNFSHKLLPLHHGALFGQPLFIKADFTDNEISLEWKIFIQSFLTHSCFEISKLLHKNVIDLSSNHLMPGFKNQTVDARPKDAKILRGVTTINSLAESFLIPFSSSFPLSGIELHYTSPSKTHLTEVNIKKPAYLPEIDIIFDTSTNRPKQMPIEITAQEFFLINHHLAIYSRMYHGSVSKLLSIYCNYFLFPRFLQQLDTWVDQPIECSKCATPYFYPVFEHCANCGNELTLKYNKDRLVYQFSKIKELIDSYPTPELEEGFYYIKNQFKLLFPSPKKLKRHLR